MDNLYQLWEERGQGIYEDVNNSLQAKDEALTSNTDEENGQNNGKGTRWLSIMVNNANFGMWKTELSAVISQNIETVWTVGILSFMYHKVIIYRVFL